MNKKYVCDVETGGLDKIECALMSVTLKEYGKNRILDIFIKPTKLRYEAKALEINGLTKKFLREHGVTEKQAIKLIKEFTNGEVFEIIGQNVSFDYEFLRQLFFRHNENPDLIMSWRLRDTMVIGKFLSDCGLKNYSSFSLGTMYEEEFGRKIKKQHTSLADVKATERLYKKFVECVVNGRV